ncbi:hypothetical protein HL653_13025 [Sphingomonas sp. AP4-R1]|uniref:hypothetical protein n=1 Tax=Sphingomonas sp. AP4-R1 TaxID=2735134 RepID=UPI0014938AA6|nr:hypothetical protein [Sphingomonas sp. AP4-R1]QJU58562.1 hypothetical protein HL653_13025 [Sphingomonas sp. AP4-R1]
MIDDPVSARLEEAAHAPVPLRLHAMDDAILARMGEIRDGRRQAAVVGSGIAVALFALSVGLFGGMLPAASAPSRAFDPGLAYAPSTLLAGRG